MLGIHATTAYGRGQCRRSVAEATLRSELTLWRRRMAHYGAKDIAVDSSDGNMPVKADTRATSTLV